MSDISGQGIKHHDSKPENAIILVTNWLRNASKQKNISGGFAKIQRYKVFKKELTEMSNSLNIKEDELEFNDYSTLVSEWIEAN